MSKSFQYLFIVSLLLLTSCGDGDKKTQEQIAVGELLSQTVQLGSPGASVSVIHKGEIVYSSAFGEAQVEYHIPITTDTVFHAASVSKQFTAFAIALLAERNLLSLDDDVRKYLPEIPDFGEVISIRQLANHTSGLRDQWSLMTLAGWRLDDVFTTAQIMKIVERQEDLNFSPGEKFLYSNTGYTLLAEIVARVSGMSFSKWMDLNVFTPLRMAQTHIHTDHEHIVENRAYSYQGDRLFKKAILSFSTEGATSVFTTAEDLALWLNNFSTKTLGGQFAHEQLLEKTILNNGNVIDYGLGVIIDEYRGLKRISHSGADAGFRSNVIYFPDQELGVAILSNISSFKTNEISLEIAEIYLDNLMEPAEGKASNNTIPNANYETKIDVELGEIYAGLYEFDFLAGLTIEITYNDGELGAIDSDRITHQLVPLSDNRFRSLQTGTEFIFEVENDNLIDLTLINNNEYKAKKIKVIPLTLSELAPYIGKYYSEELDTIYSIIVVDGQLVAEHSKNMDINLTQIRQDVFSGSVVYFAEVKFFRDQINNITSLIVSNGRSLNIKFNKLD